MGRGELRDYNEIRRRNLGPNAWLNNCGRHRQAAFTQ